MRSQPLIGPIAASAIVLAVWWCAVISAAPPPAAAVSDVSTHPELDADEPVKYDGAQLWRIPFDRLQERNAVADLQNTFGKTWAGGCMY